MSDQTATRTNVGSDTWTDAPETAEVAEVSPRLRVLFHVDLHRVGQVSRQDAFLRSSPWLVVGRHTPVFAEGPPTLADPTISREHVRIRWVKDEQVFEIEPVTEAKLKIRLISVGNEGTRQPIHVVERTRAEPGSCLVIGNRLMLALETVRQHHGPDEDRLGLIGESERIWALRKHIREVAALSRPALIVGPTGAGKELVCHAIHQASASRRERPLVIANCAAMPENIIESLLFGHRKGAFTGASESHTGLFRAADRGSLFLDEIGELPIGLQPKLLRTVQDGQVTAVGDTQSVQVDVRLIAATNRNPEEEIRAGRLREDLYHRLCAYLIEVPALNEHRLDIPELFVAFLQRYSAESPESSWMWRAGKRWAKTIPLSWFLELLSVDWTGNIRQLQNVAARTIQRNLEGPPFKAPTLPTARTHPSWPGESKPAAADESVDELADAAEESLVRVASETLDLAPKTVRKILDAPALRAICADGVDAAERTERLNEAAAQHLVSLLERNGFSQRKVCTHLDVSPSTLIKLMQRYEIPRPSDLTLDRIDAAIAEVGDDLDDVAKRLRVSPQGLRRQLTLLNLKR